MGKTKALQAPADHPLSECHVSMSNALSRAAQGLSLAEKRIVAMGLAKTDSMPLKSLAIAVKEGWRIRIFAAEYAEEFGVSADTAYNQLKDAGDHLVKRQVRTFEETPRGLKEIKTNWCGQVIYHHGEGWVEIGFSSYISPHLIGLRSKFTSYKLKQASALRSIYSWRLFECLQSWKTKEIWKPTIEEFCNAMEPPMSLQNDFGQLRRRVIEPAVKELIEKDNMKIEWSPVKAGRKVTGLVFKFQPNPQQKLDF
jgi:plasmid replication initiation protein